MRWWRCLWVFRLSRMYTVDIRHRYSSSPDKELYLCLHGLLSPPNSSNHNPWATCCVTWRGIVLAEIQPPKKAYELKSERPRQRWLPPLPLVITQANTFIRDYSLWFNATASREHNLGLRIINPLRKLSSRKPPKHNRMNRPNPRTRQHRIHRLRNHRHYPNQPPPQSHQQYYK